MGGDSAQITRWGEGPWFRQHPRRAALVAGLLFLSEFVLRSAVGDSDDAISALYVLPVALLALSFGFWVGLAAGVGAVGLIAAWVLIDDVTMSPLGWASRATPLLLLGALVGFASDQLRDAARRERHFEAVALLQREAAELNDAVVQHLAVAKWSLEAGDAERGLAVVNETMETAQILVSRMLGSDSPLQEDRLRSRAVHTSPRADDGASPSSPLDQEGSASGQGS